MGDDVELFTDMVNLRFLFLVEIEETIGKKDSVDGSQVN